MPNHHTRDVPANSEEQRAELRRRTTAQAPALRARIVLKSAEGHSERHGSGEAAVDHACPAACSGEAT